jgi:hypothetical protein
MKNSGYAVLIATVIAFSLLLPFSFVQGDQVSIFELPSGTRSAGLAGAVTALADNPESWTANPATTARLEGWDGSLQNIFWLYDMYHLDLDIGKSLKHGFMTGGFRFFSPGQFINFDQWGYEKTQSRVWDSSLAVGYAVSVLPWVPFLDAGFSLKWVHRTYDPGEDNALALDIGFIGRFKVKPLRYESKTEMKNNFIVGLSFRNLAGKVGKDTLPAEMRVGVQYRPIQALMVVVDYGLVFQSRDTFRAAVEYNLMRQFFLRCGYSYSESGLSVTPGLGFQFMAARLRYEVEYAFLPLPNDRNIHSIGVRMSIPDLKQNGFDPDFWSQQTDEERDIDIANQLVAEKHNYGNMTNGQLPEQASILSNRQPKEK